MPGMDRTGPMGTGPIGRGMGPCGDGQARGGRFRRFKWGGGFGWNRMLQPLSPDEEKMIMENQKAMLETQVEILRRRIEGLSTPQDTD